MTLRKEPVVHPQSVTFYYDISFASFQYLPCLILISAVGHGRYSFTLLEAIPQGDKQILCVQTYTAVSVSDNEIVIHGEHFGNN